jgi:hypothetical protein
MIIEFDPAKSERNVHERGLPFDLVAEFEWDSCQTYEDTRFDYPEPRRVSVGYIRGRLHVVCHTPVRDGLRVISLRKANKREVRRYEEKKAAH